MIEIKQVYSSDIDKVWSWEPENPYSFHFPFDVFIGEKGNDAADIFTILVSSVDRLSEIDQSTKCIVLPRLDMPMLIDIVSAIVKHCAAKEDPVLELRKCFHWEYEGYNND